MMVMLWSCIEDGFTTSPSDQPEFSVDTLKMGLVFTGEPTATHRFVVHNRHGKGLGISHISLSGENASLFRLNVDGMSGKEFSDVEIRAKDSIFVFVEATLPVNGRNLPVDVNAVIEFVTNGVVSKVVLNAKGQDVERMSAVIIDEDLRLTADKPYQIFDSLVVSPGATLRLAPGTTLYFHDKASLVVRGTLISEGSAEAPVTITGDRMGNVITNVSFDLMSRQWAGAVFASTSHGNTLSHTCIRNTVYGVVVNGDGSSHDPVLTLLNCRLRNSGGVVMEAYHAGIRAIGCEFAEASQGIVYLQGGDHTFEQCTFANYYLFSAIGGPAVQLAHLDSDNDDGSGLPYTSALFVNSIIYGNGSDISHGDLTGTSVFMDHCLLKSEGSDDSNFISCIWGKDPLYYTVREDYVFDYRLRPLSPAIGMADRSLDSAEAEKDWYGNPRGENPDLGAYVHVEETQQP